MFRVLLPDGELTLSTRIEFLREVLTEDSKDSYLAGFFSVEDECNCIFVHLKSPQTPVKGILIGNLHKGDIVEIKTNLLKDGFYDFSKLPRNIYASNLSMCKGQDKYMVRLSEQEYERYKSINEATERKMFWQV